MKLTIYEEKQIELDMDQMRTVTLCYLRSLVHPGRFLVEASDGKATVTRHDPHSRHGFETIRDATELDVAVFRLLPMLIGHEDGADD